MLSCEGSLDYRSLKTNLSFFTHESSRTNHSFIPPIFHRCTREGGRRGHRDNLACQPTLCSMVRGRQKMDILMCGVCPAHDCLLRPTRKTAYDKCSDWSKPPDPTDSTNCAACLRGRKNDLHWALGDTCHNRSANERPASASLTAVVEVTLLDCVLYAYAATNASHILPL